MTNNEIEDTNENITNENSCEDAAPYPQNPATGFQSNFKRHHSRIIGGYPVPYGDAPWQAVLVLEDYGLLGGGTLISAKYVVTAAHCMNYEQEMYTIILGEHILGKEDSGEVNRKISMVKTHPKFDVMAESRVC